MTEAMIVRREGRRLYLAHAAASSDDRPQPVDTGVVVGADGDTIAVDQHAERTAGPSSLRRYLFARAAGDTADQGHAGTLCGSYMRAPAP
jgi:hypothetical protein